MLSRKWFQYPSDVAAPTSYSTAKQTGQQAQYRCYLAHPISIDTSHPSLEQNPRTSRTRAPASPPAYDIKALPAQAPTLKIPQIPTPRSSHHTSRLPSTTYHPMYGTFETGKSHRYLSLTPTFHHEPKHSRPALSVGQAVRNGNAFQRHERRIRGRNLLSRTADGQT